MPTSQLNITQQPMQESVGGLLALFHQKSLRSGARACSWPGELEPVLNWPRVFIDLRKNGDVTLQCIVYLTINCLKIKP